MDTIGTILKKKREELGYDLTKVSEDTKIRKKYLEAIENGTYNQIPDEVYTRSFLRIYADYLELDQVFILKRFFDETAPVEKVSASHSSSFACPLQSFFKSNLQWIIIIVIVALIVGFSVWGITTKVLSSRNSNEPASNESVTETQPPLPPTTEETPPVVDTPSDTPVVIPENLPVNPFFDRLLIEIFANTQNEQSCWVLPYVDGYKKESYFLRGTTDNAIYECKESFRIELGNAGIISFNINGFQVTNLGEIGDVVNIDITLKQEEYILLDVIKNGIVIDTRRFDKTTATP